MYDIKPLESEWKKYRKKRQKPWYIAGFIFLTITLLVIIFYGNTDISRITAYFNTMKNNDLVIVNEVKSHVLIDNALDTIETEKHIVVDAMESVEKTEPKISNILVDIPVLEEVEQPISESLAEEKKTIQIDIIETSSVTAYKDVEKRFLQSHDVDDSLFLAKSYYKKGYYKKAEYWALETNKIDENIEDSVLIFAKAKAKLGHKNEAESILTNYISKTASQEAKNVLFRIKNDTL